MSHEVCLSSRVLESPMYNVSVVFAIPVLLTEIAFRKENNTFVTHGKRTTLESKLLYFSMYKTTLFPKIITGKIEVHFIHRRRQRQRSSCAPSGTSCCCLLTAAAAAQLPPSELTSLPSSSGGSNSSSRRQRQRSTRTRLGASCCCHRPTASSSATAGAHLQLTSPPCHLWWLAQAAAAGGTGKGAVFSGIQLIMVNMSALTIV